jgi:hypothetical protein
MRCCCWCYCVRTDTQSADERDGADDSSEQPRPAVATTSGAASGAHRAVVAAPLPPLPQHRGSGRRRQLLRPELQGGVERDTVLRFIPGGPNDPPPAPGEQHEAAFEAPLEDLGSSLGRAVYRP